MTLAQDILRAKAMRDDLYKLERHISVESQKRPVTEVDERYMRSLQVRVDDAIQDLGRRAPPPLPGEQPGEYKRRLYQPLIDISEYKGVRADDCEDDVLDMLEPKLLAAAKAEAKHPSDLRADEIRELKKTSSAGHVESTFVGGKDAHFIKQMTRVPRIARLLPREEYCAMSRYGV